MSRANYTAQMFIDAIPGSGGIITAIAKRVGCSWHTAKKWIDTYPTVTKAYSDEAEGILDMAETTVLRSIKDGDVNVAKWYLTMKGDDRGYASKSKVDVTSGGHSLFDLEEWKRKRAERLAEAASMEEIECGPADAEG